MCCPRRIKTASIFLYESLRTVLVVGKNQPQAIHGSRNFFQYINWTRQLPIDMQKIVQGSVQINGFFAHPQNIILSMITYEKEEVRREGFDLIFEARANDAKQIRKFNVPNIIFDCESLKNMINWSEVGHITEPPCIQLYSNQYLRELNNSIEIIDIPGKSNSRIMCTLSYRINFRVSMPFPKYREICKGSKPIKFIGHRKKSSRSHCE